MDWVTRLNSTINYIEENLTGEISLDRIAEIACCSSYHYQRMFGYMADVPLSEYIRRRKMSRAAVDLQEGDKVIDVALRYGYDSPTSFNRAFKSIHGITPSEVKKNCYSLKAYPPITFKITIKGDTEMEYKILHKDSFRIVGVSTMLKPQLEENIVMLSELWGNSGVDGTIPRLLDIADCDSKKLLGVSACVEKDSWRYYIAVVSDKELEDGLSDYIVPSATWAVFSATGSQILITDLEKRIVTEWLPTSGYEYANVPDIEVYIDPDPSTGRYEVWIPVISKQHNC